jgi:amino acid adenylation domain-containing protein
MTTLLQTAISVNAETRPHATALVHLTERMTYGELELASNQLAQMLRRYGCQRGDRICLLMPKSIRAIVGILGILKADCVYVPLDPSSPATRVARAIALSDSTVLLCAGHVGSILTDLAASTPSVAVGWIGEDSAPDVPLPIAFTLEECRRCTVASVEYRNTSSDPAYILFTSGSTGVPKGVVITHDNVAHFIQWAIRYFGTDPNDRISAHPPLHFDLSVFDIFGTLTAGAILHLVPHELNLFPHNVAEFIRREKLTQWFSVPSVLNYMAKFDVVKQGDFPSLKRILWCGEVFPTPGLIYWMQRLPHVKFTNLYGPTEATIASSYYTVQACPDDDTASIPIGTACAGEELLVLDESLNPLPRGVVGDLYIRGVGLSPGYWKEPAKTEAAFLLYPGGHDRSDRVYKTGDLARLAENGLVYFHGRSDTQVKIRGYRIELGEIEVALQTIPELQESAVVVVESEGFEGAVIACAYVAGSQVQVCPADVKKELGKLLPSYMWPSLWLSMERLPRNASGKVDRPQLQERFSQQKKMKTMVS